MGKVTHLPHAIIGTTSEQKQQKECREQEDKKGDELRIYSISHQWGYTEYSGPISGSECIDSPRNKQSLCNPTQNSI